MNLVSILPIHIIRALDTQAGHLLRLYHPKLQKHFPLGTLSLIYRFRFRMYAFAGY